MSEEKSKNASIPAQKQDPPGETAKLRPTPDHGEDSYKGSGRLEGKVALITGADSGIGRAVAIAFAREGADVAISYLEEEKDARETLAWVEKAGRRGLLLPGDIADHKHCADIVAKTVDAFGRIDVLVNNAAFQYARDGIDEVSIEEWDKTYKTNIYAPFYLCKAAVPHMKKGAAIINTTSIQSKQPSSFIFAYASTKGAISNFTVGLAELLADKGIRVNAVAPGPIWTPLIPATMPEDKVEGFGEDTPLGRAGQPAELAPAYVLLASDEASYISGAIIPVTGGKGML